MRIADELHDYFVRLPNESTHQIDTIFLCRNFILSIEIKNIVGRIDFEQEKHQFFRTMEDGTIQGFRNRIDQVVRHQRWIASFVKGEIPVEYAVVFSNPKTIIGKTSGANIFHASGLESQINRLIHNHSKQCSSEELRKIIRDLLAIKCKPSKNLEVNPLMLRKGVPCKHCNYQFTMQFRYGKFECSNCLIRSNESLREDYRLLISEWISNQAFRDFFEIDSADASKRLLKSLKLQYRGLLKIGSTKFVLKNDLVAGKFRLSPVSHQKLPVFRNFRR